MQPNLLQYCGILLTEATQRGAIPAMFVMNPATRKQLTDIAFEHVTQKRTFSNLLMWFRKKHLALQTLHGVPVCDNSYFPDGLVSLQLVPPKEMLEKQIAEIQRVHGMGQPQGAPAEAQQAAQSVPAAAPVKPADSDTPTLKDLATSISAGKPSCSDILMRGFEQADILKSVAVVRVFKNGNIDLATNLGKFELQGVLQHAQMWALQNGE